jgi:transcriptional regulator with XRE-family HTH domain
MRERLDRQFAEFLKKKRGDLTYAQFARKLGVTPSTLFRLEHGHQSATLGRLDQILARLGCTLEDAFPSEYQGRR